MATRQHVPESFLVRVEVDETFLLDVLQWLSLHPNCSKPRKHEGASIFNALQDVPR